MVACGMHHTAALTTANRVYTWGSLESFSAAPTPLRRADGAPFNRIASLACGRTFTIFNTLSLTSQSYERSEASRLWRVKETVVPPLPLSSNALPALPLSSSLPGVDHPLPLRLEPSADRAAREAAELAERERIDAIDVHAIVHPLCRVCWRCDGFQPSPLRLWVCRHCFHEKALHGVRRADEPLSEYEAVRKLQCLYRARRAKRVLQQAREKRYQRVFSIKHDAFFYFNLWRGSTSWTRPPEVPLAVEIPIRDPDELPEIRPPLTVDEARVVLQAFARAALARLECRRRLRRRYEKHFDLRRERVYYKVLEPLATTALELEPQRTVLWETPRLLRRALYDLGEPIEITRLKRFANLSRDDAARVVQRLVRRFLGRQLVRRIIQSRFRRLRDDATGEFYYYNTVTHEATWERPAALGPEPNDDDKGNDAASASALRRQTATQRKQTLHDKQKEKLQQQQQRKRQRRLRAERFATEDAAATTIQALVRRFLARRELLARIRRRYRKVLDPITLKPYYYDVVLGTSSWLKPQIFGDFDLDVEGTSDGSGSGSGGGGDATLTDRASPSRQRETAAMAVAMALASRGSLSLPRRRGLPPSVTEKARRKREKRRLQKLRQALTPPVAGDRAPAHVARRARASGAASHAARRLREDLRRRLGAVLLPQPPHGRGPMDAPGAAARRRRRHSRGATRAAAPRAHDHGPRRGRRRAGDVSAALRRAQGGARAAARPRAKGVGPREPPVLLL
ncbi:hypothetical protein PINS_up007900 [Pythium insidiosum]|nr:hypothetical protein PINS_up007900 [Pythium insidiosum]